MEANFCIGGGKQVASATRKTVRCPDCRKRLLLSEIHCVGGELLGYKLPPHKPKAKTKHPRPKGDRARPARRV